MMQNNIKIAITGGICSGKSTVAKIIKEQGYKVFSCDEIYAELLKDSYFVDLIAIRFGNIKNSDGTLNRDKLSQIVFNDSDQLTELNSITHPKIMQRAMELMSGDGLLFCEVPLVFEGGFQQLFDNVIVVLRDKNERASELLRRDKIDNNQANLRINSQLDYKNQDFTKYYVIHNDGNLAELIDKTVYLLEKIVKEYGYSGK